MFIYFLIIVDVVVGYETQTININAAIFFLFTYKNYVRCILLNEFHFIMFFFFAMIMNIIKNQMQFSR